ncbi:MAG: pyruvate kinase [Acidimicrobiales bacterium]
MRRTKIVATLGPASESPDVIDALLHAGMDVARLGLAHSTPESHNAMIDRVRDRAARLGRTVGILADLPGPKIRTGEFGEGGAFLAEGDQVVLVSDEGPSDARRIVIDEPRLLDVVNVGDTIVLGDGTVTLSAVEVDDTQVRAEVHSGGRLQGRPGAHLPSDRWQPPVPTEDDLALIDSVAKRADWVAVSFVRRADELVKVREALGDGGPRLMAKVETRAAVEHLDELLEVADGVMVARGDLGIDCPIEDVPFLQKRIIGACVDRGIPVITATQMLESMITAPSPTRAEASDVANAVYDGSDALMLSAETAIGHDAPLAVRTMVRIAQRAERAGDLVDERPGPLRRLRRHPEPAPARSTPAAVTVAMTRAAGQAAAELGVDAIICCTRSGRTVRAMAGLRPRCRMVGASPSPSTVRQLALSWGVIPLEVGEYGTTDEMVWCVVEATVKAGLIGAGSMVAVLAGAPDSPNLATDVLRIVTVA